MMFFGKERRFNWVVMKTMEALPMMPVNLLTPDVAMMILDNLDFESDDEKDYYNDFFWKSNEEVRECATTALCNLPVHVFTKEVLGAIADLVKKNSAFRILATILPNFNKAFESAVMEASI